MRQLLAIALGGSVGAVARFLVANGIYDLLGRGFPHGTLFVNVSGSFLMGILSELMLQRFPLSTEYRAAILVGFLGAYTTFSTFALETLVLIEEGSLAKAGLNAFLSVVLCLVAVWAGLVWGRVLFSGGLQPWPDYDFPYLDFGLGIVSLFTLALLAEWSSHRLVLAPVHRALLLITILGLSTLLSTFWAMSKLGEARNDLHGLLGIFIFNALLGSALIWLGAILGTWLWQNET
jgi:CrcB protein